MKKRLFYLPLIAFVGLLAAAFFIPVQAADQVYHYESIDVGINLQPNSDLDITETQKLVYESGTFYYAYRWIPLDRVVAIDKISVSEGDRSYAFNPAVRGWIEERQKKGTAPGGDTYAYASWVDNGKLWIGWWFPATSSMSRTWTIKYQVQGGLRIGQGTDELYW